MQLQYIFLIRAVSKGWGPGISTSYHVHDAQLLSQETK